MSDGEQGDGSARAAVLGSIRASLRRTGPLAGSVREALERRITEPRANLQPAVQGDVVERFIERFTAVSGMVTRVASLDEVPGAVAAHLEQFSLPAELVVAPDPALEAVPWPNTLGIRRGRSEGADLVSVTGAFAAIAETGTLVLLSSAHSPTTLNFLPDDHIVVLHESRITRHIEDAWTLIRAEVGRMPRTVNLISGPSKTADVEQVLQEGAHGPRRLRLLLVAG